jgi:DNA topoisomerase-1
VGGNLIGAGVTLLFVFVLLGAYGPYVQLGEVTEGAPKPKRSSLPRGLKMEEVNLDKALSLLTLPRQLGTHPETGGKLVAGLGRFGPFVLHDQGANGKDYRSIKAPDDPTTITLERTLEIVNQPKKARGTRGKATPVKELGPHPSDKEPVNIYNGPYGHYVKHGKVNASIPKERNVETVTLEEALQYLNEKKGAASTGKARKIRKSA